MKRLLSLALVGSLLLSLAGCGGETAPAAPSASLSDVSEPDISPSSAPVPSESPQVQEDDDDSVVVPAFTTTDLEGNTVTEDIFSGKDLTVVNVWATYCGPCINEMPELGRWAGELPDNVQLIGIAGDVASGDDGELHDLAVSILEEAEADFPCLTVSEDLMWVLYSISGVPTTFFVDGEGNIVGNAVLGAYVEEYKSQVEELLNGTEG